MKKLLHILSVLAIMVLSACGPDSPTKNQAAFQAQDVIKIQFANDCDFDDMDIRGEQTGNTFTVYQPFTSSRPGYERQFIYKAFVDYLGGDVYDANSWDVRTVIVEDRGTGEQWFLGE